MNFLLLNKSQYQDSMLCTCKIGATFISVYPTIIRAKWLRYYTIQSNSAPFNYLGGFSGISGAEEDSAVAGGMSMAEATSGACSCSWPRLLLVGLGAGPRKLRPWARAWASFALVTWGDANMTPTAVKHEIVWRGKVYRFPDVYSYKNSNTWCSNKLTDINSALTVYEQRVWRLHMEQGATNSIQLLISYTSRVIVSRALCIL